MRRLLPLVSVVAIVLAGALAFASVAPGTVAQDATPAGTNPSAGERGHFDLAVHFPWDPARIAHHWCKPVAGGFAECLIYASDDPDAPVMAVEEVVCVVSPFHRARGWRGAVGGCRNGINLTAQRPSVSWRPSDVASERRV